MRKIHLKKISLKNIKKENKIIICFALLIIIILSTAQIRKSFLLSNSNLKQTQLTNEQQNELAQKIKEKNYDRNEILHYLPYNSTLKNNLNINANSAILINCDTGDILYEKNPNQIIPLASMTKVFLMYTVFQKISEGKANLDEIVPLPPESWASNMPPYSSLMFLGKNQKVTLKELLTGLAVCSGNDASYAIALHLFGSIENFISEVNSQIELCGLKNTKIVEPSGYSEENITTPTEMAKFARIYITKYPESLEQFHSVKKFAYPTEKNIALEDYGKPAQVFDGKIPDSIWTPIVHENTNGLLNTLDGCDGLKTGYIDESGYNLALTCKRNGERYLSVTMQGPGKNRIEGDKLRRLDGITLQEYAFSTFRETRILEPSELFCTIPVLAGKKDSITLTVPYQVRTCVPINFFGYQDVELNFSVPKFLFGKVEAAQEYGKLFVSIDGMIIEEVPLIAQQSIEKSWFGKVLFDKVVYLILRK